MHVWNCCGTVFCLPPTCEEVYSFFKPGRSTSPAVLKELSQYGKNVMLSCMLIKLLERHSNANFYYKLINEKNLTISWVIGINSLKSCMLIKRFEKFIEFFDGSFFSKELIKMNFVV